MKWRVLLVFVVVLLAWPTVLTHLFFWRIEHRLNLKINRKPLFTFVPGSIQLNGDFLEWKDHLKVQSGSLAVHFPISVLFQRQYPILLEGRNLTVEFSPGLRKTLGGSEFSFDRVAARLKIDSRHGVDIDFLDAESKTIQFHLSGGPKRGRNLSIQTG